MRRRDFLQAFAGGALAAMLRPAWAAPTTSNEFFVFIHAGGGWDVTLWADPRNERRGLVEPAHSGNTDWNGVRRFKRASLGGGVTTFEPIAVGGHRFGPAIGDLVDLHDRLTIINGVAMNTLSHLDGTTFSTTGRHRSGAAVIEPSIDTIIASELGATQLMPNVAIQFPSAFVGGRLDRRTIPLRVANVEGFTRAFARSRSTLSDVDRNEISAMLTEEASDLARQSTHQAVYDQLASQHNRLPSLVTPDFTGAFDAKQLQASYPQFNYKSRSRGNKQTLGAFAVEALRRNVARCIGLQLGGLDTHEANYRYQALTLQEMFDVVTSLVKTLDVTPHPTRTNSKLSEHTHIMVVSEFCRTPQINQRGGRDHYPNNSVLVISPRFRGGKTYGKTDLEQILPQEFGTFTDGKRAIAPPDILATFLSAFKIDPRRFMRDGEIVKALLV